MMSTESAPDRKPVGWPAGDWFIDYGSPMDLVAIEKQQVLVRGRSRFQEYEIFLSSLWGKVLVLDDRVQSAEADEFIYHEALVQPAMIAHPAPRQILVMGGGEGATLREVLRHNTVERAVMVDIDEQLVHFCREWLPAFHQGAFDDPRTQLVFADGRKWLAEQPDGNFDVIVLDLPEPLEAGPALLLFTLEMYRLVQSKLAPGGIMAMQSGSAGILGQLLPDIHRTLKEVFPLVMPYTAFVSSFMDLYGFQVAGGQDFSWPGAAEVAHRLEARGITGLGWFGPEYAAALPCLPVYLRARLNQLGRLLTDEAPFGPRRDGERLFY